MKPATRIAPATAPARSADRVVDVSGEHGEEATARAEGAVDSLRKLLSRKVAEVIRSDPAEADKAVELGIVDRRWLEDPVNEPISTSKPTEILESFLARSVERKPSLLSTMGLSAVQLLSSQRKLDGGETQVVTVAFTDLEGFTAFTDAHGDTEAAALVTAHQRAAGPVVRRWRGRLVKHLGDGLLCTFPDTHNGIRAVLELVASPPGPLRLRAGMHLGEVVVSNDDVLGQVVNVAARVTETANGDQVVVTGDVVASAASVPGVEFRRLRRRRLKGISEKVDLYEALQS